jgi:ferric-dicitrate binding protein FerR (iron transport regulator)
MPKERTIIDYEIIWKKINQSLSDEEELLLRKWLDESESHKRYFDETIRYYRKKADFNKEELDTKTAWNTLKIKGKSKRKYSGWVIISSLSVAAAVFLILTWLLPINDKNKGVTENKIELIQPGRNQATLILNDGSVLDLGTSKELQLKEGDSDIKIEGTKLLYTINSAASKEIKYNTLSVPRGGEYFLELSDGTKVWLNSETTLRYPVQFVGNERRVELSGEAFFEVVRNENSPFLVESGEQIVKVLGTEFNISSVNENMLIYTTLVRGSVEVYLKTKPDERKMLVPKEQSFTITAENLISKRKVDPYQFTAWKEGRFVFEDQNLGEIMKTLSKWYNVDVVFAREDLRSIRFTGNLPRYSSFNEILTKIGKTNEVKFRIENRTIIIN